MIAAARVEAFEAVCLVTVVIGLVTRKSVEACAVLVTAHGGDQDPCKDGPGIFCDIMPRH